MTIAAWMLQPGIDHKFAGLARYSPAVPHLLWSVPLALLVISLIVAVHSGEPWPALRSAGRWSNLFLDDLHVAGHTSGQNSDGTSRIIARRLPNSMLATTPISVAISSVRSRLRPGVIRVGYACGRPCRCRRTCLAASRRAYSAHIRSASNSPTPRSCAGVGIATPTSKPGRTDLPPFSLFRTAACTTGHRGLESVSRDPDDRERHESMASSTTCSATSS